MMFVDGTLLSSCWHLLCQSSATRSGWTLIPKILDVCGPDSVFDDLDRFPLPKGMSLSVSNFEWVDDHDMRGRRSREIIWPVCPRYTKVSGDVKSDFF